MKFVIVFLAVSAAYVQANVAFDRSAIEHSTYPIFTSNPLEYRYAGLEHLGYSLFHNQDINGQYNFGYDTVNHRRNEARDALGNVVGSYSYVDADGKLQTVNYRADERGFNVAGTIIPDASSVVANLEPVHETEEVKLAREAHLKAYEDFVSGRYNLPIAPEAPAGVLDMPELRPIEETEEVKLAREAHLKAYADFVGGKYNLPVAPEVPATVSDIPELKAVDDEPHVALAKKEFLDRYDATVALLKRIESGESTTLTSIHLPQPVSDEPLVAYAKKEHNEYREALKEQYEAFQKLSAASVVPILSDSEIIPTPIVGVKAPEYIAPVVPEVKSEEVLPLLSSTSYIAPTLTIVAEGKVDEPLIASVPSSLPIAPAVESISPIVVERKVHESLFTPSYSALPLISSSYVAPALKTVSPIVTEGKVHEPLFTPSYFPQPSISAEGKSFHVEGKSTLYNPYFYPYHPYGYAYFTL